MPRQKLCHAVRFVFPHAPSIPVTVNGGMVMPAWYDILGMDFELRVDEAGVRRKLLFTEEAASRFGVEVLFGVRAA